MFNTLPQEYIDCKALEEEFRSADGQSESRPTQVDMVLGRLL